MAAAIENFGRLDILVNNAGAAGYVLASNFTEELYQRIFSVNVLGPMLLTTASLKQLGEGASIINIGSVSTHFVSPGTSVFTTAKSAIDGFTSVLANELGPRQIRVNSLKPGMTATEKVVSSGHAESDAVKAIIARTSLGRLASTQDIAKAAVFLASDDASFVTGDHFMVGGGLR